MEFTAALANTAITFAFRQDPAFLSFSNAALIDLTTSSGNLLVDGDFSGGTIGTSTATGWTYANIYGATYGGVVESGCGLASTNCWYDGAVQAYDAISQTVATNPGDVYQISFNLNGGGFGNNPGFYSDLSTNGDITDTGGTFDYVFAADGARSRVREMLGLGFSGYTHKRTWSIADAMIPDWPFPDAMAMASLHRNGDLGFIIPIGPKRFRAVSNTLDPLGHLPGVAGARITQSDTFHIPVRQADRYQAGGVFLGGDAAHVHSPIGARGMNLGIEDAHAFARRLADGTLDGYTAERHPIGRRWIVLSERMLAAVQSSNPLAIPFRNLAIRTIGRLPGLQKPMMERIAGLRE